MDAFVASIEKTQYGVTPALFSRTIVASLLDYIEYKWKFLVCVDRNTTEDDISTPIASTPASPVAEPVTELLSPIVRASPNAEDVVESGPLPPVDETIAETLPANVVQPQTTSSGEELSAMAPKFGTSYRSNVSVDSHQAPQAVNEAVITSIQDEIAFILGKISLAIHDHKDVEALENGRALDRMTDLLSTTNKVSEALNKTTGTSQVVPKDFPVFQLSLVGQEYEILPEKFSIQPTIS